MKISNKNCLISRLVSRFHHDLRDVSSIKNPLHKGCTMTSNSDISIWDTERWVGASDSIFSLHYLCQQPSQRSVSSILMSKFDIFASKKVEYPVGIVVEQFCVQKSWKYPWCNIFNFFGRKNLCKFKEKLPNMMQFRWGSHSISTFLDEKIYTKWGNKPPKYNANSLDFGHKNLSFYIGIAGWQALLRAKNRPLVLTN